MQACLNVCAEQCAGDNSLTIGCNQTFSCVHACKMRSLGLTKEQCESKCDEKGCNRNVLGHTFGLCGDCNRGACSSGWPSAAECKFGCADYI